MENSRSEKVFMQGYINLKVSDIEKAFDIFQSHWIGAEFNTLYNTIELDLNYISVEQLINILSELKPLLVPDNFRGGLISEFKECTDNEIYKSTNEIE